MERPHASTVPDAPQPVRRLRIPPALLLAVFALLSRILGMVRDHLLARTYGPDLDLYYAAFRIPDMLYNLLVFGAVSAAFIPIFTRHKQKGDLKEAWAFASSMLHLLLIGLTVLAAAAWVAAPWLVKAVAAGFSPQDVETTMRLMRIMLLSPLFFAASAVIMAAEDSFRQFFWRSLGPVLYNVGIIVGIVLWGQKYGLMGVAWGVLVGAGLQMLVQFPALPAMGFRHSWVLGFRRPDVRQAIRFLGPRVLALGLFQAGVLLNTFIASFLKQGSLAAFSLADNLQAVPFGMVAISMAIVSFASLSELAAEEHPARFVHELRQNVHHILFWMLPASVGLFVLRREIVALLFQAGRFDAIQAGMTADVLGVVAVSLFAQSLVPLLGRAFYARHEAAPPLVGIMLGMGVNAVLSATLALGFGWGIVGVAVGWAVGQIVDWIYLLLVIEHRTRHAVLDLGKLMHMGLSAVLMGLAVWAAKQPFAFTGGWVEQGVLVGFWIAVGGAVYLGLSFHYARPELEAIFRSFKRRK